MISFPNPKPIAFRQEIPEINDTGYLTHSVFFHPAKFIPQVVRFCLKNYVCNTSKGSRVTVVLDPYAGSGTTGLEASIVGVESYLIELNPFCSYIYDVKFANLTNNELDKFKKYIGLIFDSRTNEEQIGNSQTVSLLEGWKDLTYWYPEQLFDFWCGIWSRFHGYLEEDNSLAKKILALSLLKVSKKYSFAEHNMPKLFTSRRKRKWLENALNALFVEEIIRCEVEIEAEKLWYQLYQLTKDFPRRAPVYYYTGLDSASLDFDSIPVELDAIITSPPYLQAQEYLRTFKMELIWLGYSSDKIKSLQKLEIPFRPSDGKRIEISYLESLRSLITDRKLLTMFDSYFWYVLKTLESASKKLRTGGKLCVFIGSPKMQGIEVEIWKAIYEYFVGKLDFKMVEIFDDKIVRRKLFSNRNNPNPEGMKSEFMIVLEKR
ncbi:MAG: hypothetical protein D6687_01520 [Acidobacteria bacterium]|jgi:DNA modification methylase|nr:MAG: hypothetical protein D6687_01520 [Acidobacteriota bacterium]GIU81954.1 MAG: hypothetical protein KatS3mg006_1018 [Pyrinomonadaceae bacterium]